MKKLSLLIIVTIISLSSFSQVTISPFAGYMFGGKVTFYEGKYNVTDGMSYGLALIVPIREVVDVEINYTRMDSEGRFTSYGSYPGYSDSRTDMSTNYFQIGVIKALSFNNPQVIPFSSFSVGATWFDLKENGNRTLFSITAGLGAKVKITERIGLIVRGRLMLPMFFGGVGFSVGSGGSGLSLNSYSAIIQGDFNAGLTFKLGD